MTMPDIHGLSLYDSDLGTHECFESYLPLILILARNAVPSNIGPVDYEDIAQDTCLKFWEISQRQSIESPKAYIKRIVHTIVIDMARKYKPRLYQALPTDEDGEIQEGHLIVTADVEMDNPETVVEHHQELIESMTKLIAAVSKLHPRQQHVMICRLIDQVDDLNQLIAAFQENGLDSSLQWPQEKAERHLLQASYPPAKQNIAHCMNIDLSEY